MKDPFFFGYGSLVNRATHDYPNAIHATAHGWRRAWVDTPHRSLAILTAVPAPGDSIDGLIAAVPGADWAALDAREKFYDRIHDHDGVDHTHAHASDIAIYAVPEASRENRPERHPILLSYLDVVIQGYLREFGEVGVAAFIATTDGWDAPVLDDRSVPVYPRHQALTGDETAFVDETLRKLGVRRVRG